MISTASRHKPSAILWGCAVAAWLVAQVGVATAAPSVANVRASQRADGSGLVDVYYDLSGGATGMMASVVFSNDDGAHWNVLPNTSMLSGDYGTGIANGTNKHIVWDAGRDRALVNWPQTRAKVTASEVGNTVTFMLPGGVPLEMMKIPAGTFQMGSGLDPGYSSTWEAPPHMVSIQSDFYLGKFEVTQKQWYAVMGYNPAATQSNVNNPVEEVNWNDCQAFVVQLNTLGLGTYRLPSEAEWEYSCRAGSTTRWFFGDDSTLLLGNYAWYNGASPTHPVGQKLANAFGLYDILGNVWEWCEDDSHSNYSGAPTTGVPWVDTPTRGSTRVLRGGAFDFSAVTCRSASRFFPALGPTIRSNDIGLRLVRTQ